MNRNLLALFGGPVLVPCALIAQEFGDFTYSSDGTSIRISRYNGSGGVVTVPDTINGLRVGQIGCRAFFECTNVSGITIPNSVTSIGDEAFSGCSNLTDVTIPDGVTAIWIRVFAFCRSLTNVTIPSGVQLTGC